MSTAAALPPLMLDAGAPRQEIARFLAADRLLCAYALADLDARNVAGARWWLARRDGEPVAAAVVMTDLSFRPAFVCGEVAGARLLLRNAVREERVIISAPTEHRQVLEESYRLQRVDRMLRMAVDRASFRPDPSTREVVRLGPSHLEQVVDLYGPASRSYFTERRLSQEIYVGVFDGPMLVSAAGTHVRSVEFGIAAVGNVLTRVPYRNQGLARACTSAVTAACLAEHPDMVLNVREDNEPAVAIYRRLGYRTHRPFIESPGYRRTLWERLAQQLLRVVPPAEGNEA